MRSFLTPSLLALALSMLALTACSSSSSSDPGAAGGGGAGAAGAGGSGGGAGGTGGGAGDAAGGAGGSSLGGAGGSGAAGAPAAGGAGGSGPSESVTFSYRPSWSGVVSVEVVGAFGQPGDWKTPLVTLSDDGSGRFTGTVSLPEGTYLYVFRVVGDGAATMPDKLKRYVLDPSNPSIMACPVESPTFTMAAPNPCSSLTVPQPAPATPNHVTGAATSGGKPAAGWLVELEREEPKSHHYFVDRMTTGADGTFDLAAAPGNYRLQLLLPDYYSATDATRSPQTEPSVRRAVSAPFDLSAAVAAATPDVAFTKYPLFKAPSPAVLPSTFGFNDDPATTLDVYGPGTSIGDPWFASKATGSGMASFDGTFTTKQAKQTMVTKGTTYFWGTETSVTTPSGKWLLQSLVFPITWM